MLATHDWLKDRGYTCPTSNLDTAYQIAHNTKLHWFEHLQSTPPHGKNFNDHMFGYLQGRPEWTEIYPAEERLIEGFDTEKEDSALLVDIGGGIGHYTEQFRSRFPEAPGRFIVQDLPVVIRQIQELDPRIEKAGYDFFTEQPVKGGFHNVARTLPLGSGIANRVLSAPRCTRLLYPFHSP